MKSERSFKHVGFITRREDQSFAQFIEHWEEVHSRLVLKLPKLRGYVLNPIDREQYPDSPVDGFSELWFDSLEDAKEAFNSPAGKEIVKDTSKFTNDVIFTYLTENRRM